MTGEIATTNTGRFYIGGSWVDPAGTDTIAVVNPATEQEIARIAAGNADDVDRAVAAARGAFDSFSQTSVEERVALLDRIIEVYQSRAADLAAAVSAEMGAPARLALAAQVPAGLGHIMTVRAILADYDFDEVRGRTLITREPIGVAGLITPWNWPLNQIGCKVGPAIAAGCTMVLKPSEVSPLNALIFAEIMHEAGVPAGVFNLVNGTGIDVGAPLSAHPDIDMMSFTGSTRAGAEVAKAAAPTIKRVAQELGGKSANIILDSDDFAAAVARDAAGMCSNTGQSCNAATRMLVPHSRMDEAAAIAVEAMSKLKVGDPQGEGVTTGPVVSETQWDRVQRLIEKGIGEGAKVATGGPGKPEGLDVGYYVKPTVFSHVTNDMTIAREEIFGPVLVIIGYDDVDDAVSIANDNDYGLSGYVSGPADDAKAVARRIRTGMVHLNGAGGDLRAPFGGYKMSGNGREWGVEGFEEFLETKSVYGWVV